MIYDVLFEKRGDNSMTTGERIKQLRREAGYTQVTLAETLNVTKGTVSTWETNSRTPNFETLTRLSDLFGRSIDYIMARSDDPTPPHEMTVDEEIDSALYQVEMDLTEYALKYARLDQYGRDAVEAVIRAEYNRCRGMNTLCPAEAYSGGIKISRKEI